MPNKISLSAKQISIVLTVLFILSLLPILCLGFYSHPCADDFSYASATRKVWLESHSVWQTLKEAAATSASRYQTWQGTFTSIFFMALQPAIWTEQAYAVTPFLMAGILCLSVCYLTHVLVTQYLKGSRPESAVLSLLLLFASIQCMVGKTDAFFWYNGSVHYIVPFSFFLLMIGALLSAFLSSGKAKIRKLAFASLCALFVGGGNYVSGLVACVCSASLLLLLLWRKKLREQKAAVVPVLILFLSFLINMAAPGNSVREAAVQGMPPIKAILVSFRFTLFYAIDQWTTWTVLALTLLSLPFLWNIVKRVSFSFPCPLLTVAYSFCLLSCAFTPSLYATGNVDAPRIQNIIFLLYLLLLFLNAGYLLGWACHHFRPDITGHRPAAGSAVPTNAESPKDTLSSTQQTYFLCAVLAFLFCLGITIKPNPDYYTTTSALMELATGQAQAYGDEMERRLALLHLPKEDILLPRIQTQPPLLYHTDITSDPGDWSNMAMSRYYQKNSIALEP